MASLQQPSCSKTLKIPLRKSDRTFSEEMLKRAALQSTVGTTGNEIRKDYLLNEYGQRIEIGWQLKGIGIDENGLPQVRTENYGTVLGCGHRAFSLNDVQGSCYRGHTVCVNSPLYTCVICGNALCDKDVVRYAEQPICEEHRYEVIGESILMSGQRLMKNVVWAMFGFDGDE